MPKRPRPTPPRTRWTPAQARALLDEQASSGQGVATFARSRGLDPQRIYAWRRRLPTETHPGFVEIHPTARVAAPTTFELTLGSSLTLRFDAQASPNHVAAIVRALREVGSC